MPGKFEVYQEKAQEYRFRLKTATGEVVAVSEAHDSMEACRRAIEAVRKHAPTPSWKTRPWPRRPRADPARRTAGAASRCTDAALPLRQKWRGVRGSRPDGTWRPPGAPPRPPRPASRPRRPARPPRR
ncbi:YegP family protein [Streptacidiphilus monticola]